MRRLPLAIALLAAAGTSQALPFAPFDVRAAGMGGTGVAAAKAGSAALYNPALLSAQAEGEKFQFVLGFGAVIADESEMFDEVDDLQDAIEAFNAEANGSDDPLELFTQASAIAGSLTEINDKLLTGDAGGVLGVGVPGQALGVGVFVAGHAYLLGSPSIADNDLSFLTDIITDYLDDNVLSGDIAPLSAESEVTGVAVSVIEYGVALSRRIDLANGGQLSLGITPKAVSVGTFEYTATVDDFDIDDLDAGDNETTDSGFGLDAGLAWRASAESPWQFGLVARNLVGSDYETVSGRDIELATQLRAGIARTSERATLALDVDLTENDGITDGDATQFAGVGAEYDLKYVQLRAGYRLNLADSEVADVASVGLGLGPVDVTAVLGDNTWGAMLNLGFGW